MENGKKNSKICSVRHLKVKQKQKKNLKRTESPYDDPK